MTQTDPQERHHNDSAEENLVRLLQQVKQACRAVFRAHGQGWDCYFCQDTGTIVRITELLESCLWSQAVPFDELEHEEVEAEPLAAERLVGVPQPEPVLAP